MAEPMSCEKLWADAFELIGLKVGQATKDAVLRGVVPVSFDADTGEIVLQVPTDFVRNLIVSKHLPAVNSCLAAVDERCVKVRWEVSADKPTIIEAAERIEAMVATVPNVPLAEERGEFRSSLLDPEYTPEAFVRADSNRFAHAKLFQLVEQYAAVGHEISLARLLEHVMVVYGSSGVGKSHVVQAFVRALRLANPYLRVGYTTSEQFINHCVKASGAVTHVNQMVELQDFYRNLHVWVVDDVQSFLGTAKPATINEFFATFDILKQRGLVILVCDVPPHTLGKQEERYVTRLQKVTFVDMRDPEPELIAQILRGKAIAQDMRHHFTDEVIEKMVKVLRGNPRITTGAFTTVCSKVSLGFVKLPLTPDAAEDLIAAFQKQDGVLVASTREIARKVAELKGLKYDDLVGPKVSKSLSPARQAAIVCCKLLTDDSLNDIGSVFDGRDHSTVLYSYNKGKALAKDPEYLAFINKVREAFGKEPVEWENLP